MFQESVEACVWGNWEKWVSLHLDSWNFFRDIC